MRTKFLLAASVLVLTACSFSPKQPAPSSPAPPKMTNKMSVIELFTSEGCSSCPSADALMPKLKERYGDNLIVLSFHVDYWDRLGWKDPFSNSNYTRRQNQYSNAFNADNVYTPQAVVNGSTGIVGSDEAGLERLISRGISSNSAGIKLSAKADGQVVSVNYERASADGEVMNIALVQSHVSVRVQRGENGGRELEHYNVVRDFRTMENSTGNLTFSLPAGMMAKDFHVIAFAQQKNMHITAAMEAGIE